MANAAFASGSGIIKIQMIDFVYFLRRGVGEDQAWENALPRMMIAKIM